MKKRVLYENVFSYAILYLSVLFVSLSDVKKLPLGLHGFRGLFFFEFFDTKVFSHKNISVHFFSVERTQSAVLKRCDERSHTV